jgi:phospho-N-acetylmuramoyl-pentapeptide-transferase
LGLDVVGRSVLVPLIVMVGYGTLGAIDDWQGLRGKRRGEGMTARVKFAAQVLMGLGTAWVLKYLLEVPEVYLPGVNIPIALNDYVYIAIAAFIIVSESNAINFTDGLDGLAGLIASTAFAAYGGIALIQGQIYLARFCFTLVGAIFGFLWFNVHPAELFMGDTGSLSLGATLAVVALMTGQWPLLLVIGIIPLSEALSVTLQIGYFKLTKGKRLFKMAPIHLHFELLGWSETQVVQRFWLIGLLAAMLGIGLTLV